MKALWRVFKQAVSQWWGDDCGRRGAALAYYTAFSMAPLLVIVVAVAGFIFGREAAQGQLLAQLRSTIGPESALFVQSMIAKSQGTDAGIVATVAGLAMLAFGATAVFAELQADLNAIWSVEPAPGNAIRVFLKKRLMSFALIVVIGFLLLVSLVVSAALAALQGYLESRVPGSAWFLNAANVVISLAIISLLFATIYKVLPDAKIAWRDVWFGAVVTSLLFVAGKFLIGFYLGRSGVDSTFGAAASLVVLLIWVYYSAQILFFGAEITQAYAEQFGAGVVPEEGAKEKDSDNRRQVDRERGREEDKRAVAAPISDGTHTRRPVRSEPEEDNIMVDQVTKSVTVNGDINYVYRLWTNFEDFPHFMENIRSVHRTGQDTTHWVASGPLGADIEWDARTTAMDENRRVAWRSIGGDVETNGQVMFEEIRPGQTRVTAQMQYAVHEGGAKEAIGKLFANPEHMVEEDLKNFKEYAEGRKSESGNIHGRDRTERSREPGGTGGTRGSESGGTLGREGGTTREPIE